MLSQPLVVSNESKYIPELVYILPFQLYVSQVVIKILFDTELLTVKSNVTTLSHPLEASKVSVYIPLKV